MYFIKVGETVASLLFNALNYQFINHFVSRGKAKHKCFNK